MMPSIHRIVVLSIVTVSLLVAGLAAAQEPPPEWTSVGIIGGAAYELAVAPAASKDGLQRIYATGLGIQSTTRGDPWEPLPGTEPMTNVRAGPGDVVFVTDGQGRAYRSGTLGRNWGRIYLRTDTPAFRFTAVSPNHAADRTVFAVTEGEWRLYRSGNGGESWTEVTLALGAKDQIGALAFSPRYRDDEIMFIGSDRGIFKWVVADQRWQLVSSAGQAPAFGAAGGPLSTQDLLVPEEYGDDPLRARDPVVHTLFARNAAGIYRSDDDGVTWRKLPLPGAIAQVNGLAVSNGWPADPVLVVAGEGLGVIGAVSHDDGATWSLIPGRDGLDGTSVVMSRDFMTIPRADITRPVVFLPVTMQNFAGPYVKPTIGTREVFLATDGDGVLRSRDAGRTWEPTAPSFQGVPITALAALGGADGAVVAGSATAGLYRSPDGGRTWSWADVGLPRGKGQTVNVLAVSPAFATDRTIFLAATSGVWVSRDAGATWTPTSHRTSTRALAVSPEFATDRTLVAQGHVSTDGGETWQPLAGDPGVAWTAAAFSANYATDQTVYFGTDQVDDAHRYGLWRTQNMGAEWKLVDATSLGMARILDLFSVKFDPREQPRVYAGTSRGLISSTDGGETWRSASGFASVPLHDVTGMSIRTPVVHAILATASDDGAVWSVNWGVEWRKEPRSPRPALSTTLASDATLVLVGGNSVISRYPLELGSADVADAGSAGW